MKTSAQRALQRAARRAAYGVETDQHVGKPGWCRTISASAIAVTSIMLFFARHESGRVLRQPQFPVQRVQRLEQEDSGLLAVLDGAAESRTAESDSR